MSNLFDLNDVRVNSLTVATTLNASIDTSVVNIGHSNAHTVNIGTGSNTQTVNVGTGPGATTINIGAAGDTVNVAGTLVTVNTQNANITDSILTLNKGGVNANSVGLHILGADPAVAAEIKTNSTGDTLQVRGITGVTNVDVGGLLINQTTGSVGSTAIVASGALASSVSALSLQSLREGAGPMGSDLVTNILDIKADGTTSGSCDLVVQKNKGRL